MRLRRKDVARERARSGELVTPWLPLLRHDTFVHGDWGTSNVLVPEGGEVSVVATIDFEDSHVGDPAEDFKWQVLAGPASPEYIAMGAGYEAGGGSLGPHAEERLAVAGGELCLGVLGWDLGDAEVPRRHADRCIATLEAMLSGSLPRAP